MISTNDFRNGTMFEMDGQLLQIVNVEHIKLARAGAVIKAKVRNLLTGAIFEHSFRGGEKFKTVRIESSEATYLYADGTHHYFMDTKTYDQIALDADQLGDAVNYLTDGMEVTLNEYEGDPIGVDMPASIVMTVASTDFGLKGDTATGATKPATLESGLKVNVPLFVKAGDKIKVDTRTGEYLERA